VQLLNFFRKGESDLKEATAGSCDVGGFTELEETIAALKRFLASIFAE